jgi:TatD DNase family protein
MTPTLLPAIDAHAHVETDIDADELKALGALVFAVTREPSEWDDAAARSDPYTVWGLGCHPSVSRAYQDFDADRLHSALDCVPLIGEVGLDRKSPVPMERQKAVLRSCLEVAAARPRLMTIHSVGAAEEVLAELEDQPPTGAILHWWRGSESQTRRAVKLGCFFSLNGAEVRNPKVMSLLPRNRVLTETDFPHTRRQDPGAVSPGAVDAAEDALADSWRMDLESFRRQTWRNLGALCTQADVTELMSRPVRATIAAAGDRVSA